MQQQCAHTQHKSRWHVMQCCLQLTCAMKVCTNRSEIVTLHCVRNTIGSNTSKCNVKLVKRMQGCTYNVTWWCRKINDCICKACCRTHAHYHWQAPTGKMSTLKAKLIHNYHGNKPEALSHTRHRWGTHRESYPGPQQPPAAPQTWPSAHRRGTPPVCLHTYNRTENL